MKRVTSAGRWALAPGAVFLICAILFSLQIIPHWWNDSIVLDEEFELTSAYYYWKTGDVWCPCGTTAPGALGALPLLAMDLKIDPKVFPNYDNRSYSFLFLENSNRLNVITIWSRAVNWLIGLCVGFFLYGVTRKSHLVERTAVFVLWAFQPLLLAYDGTAKLDIPVMLWTCLALAVFSRAQEKGRKLPFAAAGFLAGLAVSARYNGVFVLPIILILEILDLREQGFKHRMGSLLKNRWPRWLAGLGGLAAAVFFCFLPGMLVLPGHPDPFRLFFHHFWVYGEVLSENPSPGYFFAGHFWPRGSRLLFPEQFLLKNPISFLILLFLGFFLIARKKIKVPRWIWVPPMVYTGLYWIAVKGMVVRHVLPVYPFLILIAASAFLWLWRVCSPSRSALVRMAPWLLLFWGGLSVLANYPNYIAYANDFITARQKPQQLIVDNWSLGQDIKRLARTAEKRGWQKVKFVSIARTDPYFYGMDWQPWSVRDLAVPQPGTVYVIDACMLGENPAYHALFFREGSWLNRLAPTGDVGGTFYYYEIPGKPLPDDSRVINSFPYYVNGIQPYHPYHGPVPIKVDE